MIIPTKLLKMKQHGLERLSGIFEGITSEEVILAKDAHTHTATRELAANYLRQHDIQSMSFYLISMRVK